jgi:hypothetical protein
MEMFWAGQSSVLGAKLVWQGPCLVWHPSAFGLHPIVRRPAFIWAANKQKRWRSLTCARSASGPRTLTQPQPPILCRLPQRLQGVARHRRRPGAATPTPPAARRARCAASSSTTQLHRLPVPAPLRPRPAPRRSDQVSCPSSITAMATCSKDAAKSFTLSTRRRDSDGGNACPLT